MSTDRTTFASRTASIVAALAVGTAMALAAHFAGNDSLARGIVVGVGIAMLAIVALWILGERAGTAGRIASGTADERDRRLKVDALADAAVAMLMTGAVAAVAAAFGVSAIAVAGSVVWAGLLAFTWSIVVRSRRM
jgi:hypothetical protein